MKKGMKVTDLSVVGTALPRGSFALVQLSEVVVTYFYLKSKGACQFISSDWSTTVAIVLFCSMLLPVQFWPPR